MLPSSLAFGWVLWRQHGLGLIVVSGILCAGAVVAAIVPSHTTPDDLMGIFSGAFIFTIPPLAFYLLTVFTHGAENADLSARESCFSPQLLRLPVPTGELVLWLILYGAAAVFTFWVSFAWFILRPFYALHNELVPLWWPAMLLCAGLAWVQALLWSPIGMRWLRVFLLIAVVTAMITMATQLKNRDASEHVLVALLASLTGVAWLVSYVGVVHARRGNAPNWERLFLPWGRFLAGWLPDRQTLFASAPQAQQWFEWRLTGKTLPVMVCLTLPFVLLPLLLGKNPHIPTAQTLLTTLGVPVYFAGLAGGWYGHACSRWVKERSGLMASIATLPMASADMIGVMFKAAARSTLLTWTIVAATVPLAVVLSGNLPEVMSWWRHGLVEHDPLKMVGGIVAITVLLIVWTWKRKVNSLYLGLTGRKWVEGIGGACIVGAVVLLPLAIWIQENPETHATLWAMIPWILSPLTLARFLAAGWALRQILSLGLVQPKTLGRWLAAWFLLASLSITVLAWAVPGEFMPVHYLALGVLLAMPMTRLAATPLALAWNRHR